MRGPGRSRARATEAAPRANNAAPAPRAEHFHPATPPGHILGAWRQQLSIREFVRRGQVKRRRAGPGRRAPRDRPAALAPGGCAALSTVSAVLLSQPCAGAGDAALRARKASRPPGRTQGQALTAPPGQYADPGHSAVLLARTELQDCADRREEQTTAVQLELAVRCTESTAWAGVAGRHGAPACPQA